MGCSDLLMLQSLAIRSGRIEKPRRRLITKRNEATASPDMSDEVIDLQDSSREATPEIASGKTQKDCKPAKQMYSFELQRLHPHALMQLVALNLNAC